MPAAAMVCPAAPEASSTKVSLGLYREVLDEGVPTYVRVREGSALPSDARVRISVLSSQDAYVYVLIFGPLGRILLVQPGSNDPAEAWMPAGVERMIPASGMARTPEAGSGYPAVLAVAADAPVPHTDALLQELRSQAVSGPAAARFLRARYPSMARLSFRYPKGWSTSSASRAQVDLTLRQRTMWSEEQSGVLSAAGSRIEALLGSVSSDRGSARRGVDSSMAPVRMHGSELRERVEEEPITARSELSGVGPGALGESLVSVVTPTASGSGIVIDAQGYVLTNWHVIRDYAIASVLMRDSSAHRPAEPKAYLARVESWNRFSDLALLRLEAPPEDLSAAELASGADVAPGDPVYLVGPGLVGGEKPYVVTRVERIRDSHTWYSGNNVIHRATVVEARLNRDIGTSGTAMVNRDFKVIGLGAHGEKTQGRVYAVSAGTVRTFLDGVAPGTAAVMLGARGPPDAAR